LDYNAVHRFIDLEAGLQLSCWLRFIHILWITLLVEVLIDE